MRVAITGHRPARLKGKDVLVANRLYEKLKELDEAEGVDLVYTGMAKGVDQLAAYQCMKLNIGYYCVYPYERNLSAEEQYLVNRAAGATFLEEERSIESYFRRDRFMVDNCDIVLAVWDGKPNGGTYLTIEYANKIGKPVILLMKEGEL